MTKAELREKLLGGAVMDDLFAFRNGQDCEIFKATRFERSDDIIYIPDLAINLQTARRTWRKSSVAATPATTSLKSAAGT